VTFSIESKLVPFYIKTKKASTQNAFSIFLKFCVLFAKTILSCDLLLTAYF